jgi:hypothetical protein
MNFRFVLDLAACRPRTGVSAHPRRSPGEQAGITPPGITGSVGARPLREKLRRRA